MANGPLGNDEGGRINGHPVDRADWAGRRDDSVGSIAAPAVYSAAQAEDYGEPLRAAWQAASEPAVDCSEASHCPDGTTVQFAAALLVESLVAVRFAAECSESAKEASRSVAFSGASLSESEADRLAGDRLAAASPDSGAGRLAAASWAYPSAAALSWDPSAGRSAAGSWLAPSEDQFAAGFSAFPPWASRDALAVSPGSLAFWACRDAL